MNEETKIELAACELIYKRLGIIGSKLRVQGDSGWPDRVFWLPGGRPLLIEFKRPGEVPRKKQASVHRKLRALGYLVAICDSRIEALNAVHQALEVLKC
jgi:hypothetical protein